MMTWTLYLLLHLTDGGYAVLSSRTYTSESTCQAVVAGTMGRPLGEQGVIVGGVCKELTKV
jgi:hypothetical protein